MRKSLSEMDTKRNTFIRTRKRNISRDISSSGSKPVTQKSSDCCLNHFRASFQPLRHQRNVCHPTVNRFTHQTLPIQKLVLYEYPSRWVLLPIKMHNRMLLFGSTLLKHGRHFDYWNQPLNTSIHVCYVECHEAGLCCYLVIRYGKVIPVQAMVALRVARGWGSHIFRHSARRCR
jgi:hypothetical protein